MISFPPGTHIWLVADITDITFSLQELRVKQKTVITGMNDLRIHTKKAGTIDINRLPLNKLITQSFLYRER